MRLKYFRECDFESRFAGSTERRRFGEQTENKARRRKYLDYSQRKVERNTTARRPRSVRNEHDDGAIA